MGLVRSTRAQGSVGFSPGIRCGLPSYPGGRSVGQNSVKNRPILSARGDGGGVCDGLARLGRRQLYRAFCSAIAVSSVGLFAPVLLLGRTVRLMRVVVLSVILEGPVVACWFHVTSCGLQSVTAVTIVPELWTVD